MTIDAPKRENLPALRALWQEAFGDTKEYLDTFFATAFSYERCRIVIADGQVAAALYWLDCSFINQPVAYVYAVATAKAFRGQGLCHRLMEDTHRHLKASGYTGTVLVPGTADLFRFYERMGYETCSYIKEFACRALEAPVDITKITDDEYATLRRQFLPNGGILQEKENLDLLKTQAAFYRGTDFLLAARTEGTTLFGIELLGETSSTAAIVHALGCKTGTFRTPGRQSDRPFAMYRPIKKGGPTPAYFGFAFD